MSAHRFKMIGKNKFILCAILAGVILYAQAAPASSCRDYIRDVSFIISQAPDNSGNCRMEKSGEYPPDSVPFSKREGIERCLKRMKKDAVLMECRLRFLLPAKPVRKKL